MSVPSKTYSILAAGRPVLAAIDPGTEVPRILAASGGGVSVPPDDPEAFFDAFASWSTIRRSVAGWAHSGASGCPRGDARGRSARPTTRSCDRWPAAVPDPLRGRVAASLSPSWPPPRLTKKVAKLAKSGKGKKVRFQGGTLFPWSS